MHEIDTATEKEFDVEATIQDILRNFKKSTGKHLYQSLFFSK